MKQKMSNEKKQPLFKIPLLLKQTLLSTWKSKLQLVILLLLSAFATSIVTGSWISYERMVNGANDLGINDAKFDAVLPYASNGVNPSQILNQAFSLNLGRIHYQADNAQAKALYFDNTTIGEQTVPLKSSDFNAQFDIGMTGKVLALRNLDWSKQNQPVTFNLADKKVQGSVYGQLMLKAQATTNNIVLKNHYLKAANDIYNSLFVRYSATQMLASLKSYITAFIKQNPSDPILNSGTTFLQQLLDKKINYNIATPANPTLDLRIPADLDVKTDYTNPDGVLAKLMSKSSDANPRATPTTDADYGLNGQWMVINREFDMPGATEDTVSNFVKSYSSPSNYNQVSDWQDPYLYTTDFAKAAAALQNRDIHLVNQFTAIIGKSDSSSDSTSIKAVDIGLSGSNNRTNLKVFEGIFPQASNQVVISPQYARYHSIKPGSNININGKTFIVSGIGGDAYNIYPTINSLDPIPNTRSEYIVYMYPSIFYDSTFFKPTDKTNQDLLYFLPWKDITVPSFDLKYFDDYFQKSIFNSNKLQDAKQYDYDNYLIKKYADHDQNPTSDYTIVPNLVVTSDSSQFSIYSAKLTLYNKTVTFFKYMATAGTVFILSVLIFITFLIVKKGIQKNQVSMGILKSTGYQTKDIVLSYLAYPLIVICVAIPIGWFVGLLIQVYFTEIFNTIFILPYNVFSFDFIPALISVAIIGGATLVTSMLTAAKMLQLKPLSLIKKENDISMGSSNKEGWLEKKFENNFKLKFLLSLTRTSWKKVFITSSVIGLATLSITTTVSIPAAINALKSDYFASQQYKNYYDYESPIPNMPLSKYGLYDWTNLENPKNQTYYPIGGVKSWPDDVLIHDNVGKTLAWYNPMKFMTTSDTTNNFDSIVKFAPDTSTAIQADIKAKVGQNLQKTGALTVDFLTWAYSWLGGRGFSNSLVRDLQKQDLSPNKSFSNSLIALATNILPTILQQPNPGVPPSVNAISEILKTLLPGYIRQILDQKGSNAYDYFNIGFNSVALNSNFDSELGGPQEELITQYKAASIDPNLINKDFLNIVGINPETKMLTIDKSLVNKMKYNSVQTSIPMIINKAFASKYGLGTGDTFQAAPNMKTLYYLNNQNKWRPLPKSNWYYGQDPINQDNPKDVWDASGSKWSSRGSTAITDSNYSDSYGYNYNGMYDQDGNEITSNQPKSWNNSDNVWLELPDDINATAKAGYIKNVGPSSDATFHFNVNNVAESQDSPWIRPFSFSVTDKAKENPNLLNGLTLLLNKTPEWYGGMIANGILKTGTPFNGSDTALEMQTNMPEWWESLVGTSNPVHRYNIIGIQNSYDTPKAYIDQKWANTVVGYSYLGDTSNTKDPVYENGQSQWFNGKLSAADDIYDIVGRLALKKTADDYSSYGVTINEQLDTPLVANSDLLSRKKQMLNKMSDIAFSASALFIITTIICSILIVIMITDLFTDQFRRFMSHMKAEGYTNREINSFTLGIFTPWSFLGYLLGYLGGLAVVFGLTKLIAIFSSVILPVAFIWWIIPFSFLIIGGIYFSTFIINNYRLNQMVLTDLLKSDE